MDQTAQQTPAPQQPPQLPKASSSSKYTLIILVAIITVAMASATLWLTLSKDKKQSKTPVPTPSPTQIVATATPVQVTIPTPATNDWKIYRAQTFEIKYPPTWEVVTTQDISLVVIQNSKTVKKVVTDGKEITIPTEHINFITTQSTETAKEYVDNYVKAWGEESQSIETKIQRASIMLNGQLVESYIPQDTGINGRKNYVYANGKTIVEINTSVNKIDDPSNRTTEHQILTTLKFLQ